MTHPPAEQFEPTTIPELRGGRGPVRVTVLGAPALRSTHTGAVRPVGEIGTDDGEGGQDGVPFVLFVQARAMFACGSYVMKLKEYLPRLIYQCQGCQRTLAAEPGTPHRFEFEARPLDRPPFRVRLDAPAVVCPGCGRHNVLWSDEVAAQVEGAVAEAVSSPPRPGGRDEPGAPLDSAGGRRPAD